jgi:alkylation response protein AidB-like acyl-CoA dehydrogenase
VHFEFTPDQERFRTELREFLAERLPPDWRGVFGSNMLEMIPFCRSLCEELAARKWLTCSWPREYGGDDMDLWTQMVLREEMWYAQEPRGPQYMNLNYIGPAIIEFGTEEQKQRFLPPMAAGQVIWAQGFSEPEAGSDLASLRTRAVDAGDHFVVTGQKTWSSYAGSPADWCLLLVRTDPEAPKHKGISVLLVDMRSPGVSVRPIESMAGLGEINDMFFDNVQVPKANLLGEINGGWPIILYGLVFERTGIALHSRAQRSLERLIEFARTTVVDGKPLSERSDVRLKIAELYTRFRASRLVSYRNTAMVEAGENPVAEASIAWIVSNLTLQAIAEVGIEIAGAAGQLLEDEPLALLNGAFEREWVEMIPMTIGGGTVDIQRLIVAQRGLGLPKAG